MPLTPGTRLASYEIVSLLGSGGMGEVYKAKDLKLGRDVAIKVLREDLASDPERLRRFEQEARAASSLSTTRTSSRFTTSASMKALATSPWSTWRARRCGRSLVESR